MRIFLYCKSSITLLILLLFITSKPSPLNAESFESIDLDACPIEGRIRLSAPAIANKFQALERCSIETGSAANAVSPVSPPVVRIIGVTKEQIREMEEDREKYEARKAKRLSALYQRPSSLPFDREIRKVAQQHNIDPLFLHAIVETESGYRPEAVSHAGARGLMQIMPETGAELGFDEAALFKPSRNLEAGARHLKTLQRRFGRNLELVLGAYNAGVGAVEKYGNRVPPYAETRAYVGKVMSRYHALLDPGGDIP